MLAHTVHSSTYSKWDATLDDNMVRFSQMSISAHTVYCRDKCHLSLPVNYLPYAPVNVTGSVRGQTHYSTYGTTHISSCICITVRELVGDGRLRGCVISHYITLLFNCHTVGVQCQLLVLRNEDWALIVLCPVDVTFQINWVFQLQLL